MHHVKDKILILGGNGQLGHAIYQALGQEFDLTSLGRQGNGILCGDITNSSELVKTVKLIRPNFIINTAAYTLVDKAEQDQEAAFMINATAAGFVAQAALEAEAHLIHFSTDHVFDGTKDSPYDEQDTPNPINFYGYSKLKGEEFIRESGCAHTILRISWLYGKNPRNFARTILRKSLNGEALRVVNDQNGAPTSTYFVAHHLPPLLTTHPPMPHGLYHLSPQGRTTWYDYAMFIIETATHLGLSIPPDSLTVTPVSAQTYNAMALRPQNSLFNTALFQGTFQQALENWQDDLRTTLTAWITEKTLDLYQ